MNPLPSWLMYDTGGAVRNQPLSSEMLEALSFLPELGLSARVFSAGQPAEGGNRVGSTRHDHGNAADLFFYKDGRQLSYNNPEDVPILQRIVAEGKGRGLTGFGAGEGYMQPGSMHVGFGTPAVWGAGGKGDTAPAWLREAYYGGGDQMTYGNLGPAPTEIDREPFTFGDTVKPEEGGIWDWINADSTQDMAQGMMGQEAPPPQWLQAPMVEPYEPVRRDPLAAYRSLFDMMRQA